MQEAAQNLCAVPRALQIQHLPSTWRHRFHLTQEDCLSAFPQHHAAAHSAPIGVLTWHDMRMCKVTLQSSKTPVASCLICGAGASVTKAHLKSSNMRQDSAYSSRDGGIPVREKAPAMPPASSRCRGSRVGIFPSLCSTPSIQDVQSSQSSTMPALEICTCASYFRNPERARTHSCRQSRKCSYDRHCALAQHIFDNVHSRSAALPI